MSRPGSLETTASNEAITSVIASGASTATAFQPRHGGGTDERGKSAISARHGKSERVAAPGRRPVERIAQHGPIEPRTPAADEAIAVGAVPRSSFLYLQFIARRTFRGATARHGRRIPAGRRPRGASGTGRRPPARSRSPGEAAGRLESRSANEKTRRGKRDGVADHPRVGGKGVAAGVEWDRNRHPVVHPEADSTVLQRQLGERVDARITRLATRIHQARTHRGRARASPVSTR